jgi:hypothetical protein
MSRLMSYVRSLISDANLASAAHSTVHGGFTAARLRELDHPTYLRRGIVIDGLASGSRPHGPAPHASLRGCHGSR